MNRQEFKKALNEHEEKYNMQECPEHIAENMWASFADGTLQEFCDYLEMMHKQKHHFNSEAKSKIFTKNVKELKANLHEVLTQLLTTDHGIYVMDEMLQGTGTGINPSIKDEARKIVDTGNSLGISIDSSGKVGLVSEQFPTDTTDQEVRIKCPDKITPDILKELRGE